MFAWISSATEHYPCAVFVCVRAQTRSFRLMYSYKIFDNDSFGRTRVNACEQLFPNEAWKITSHTQSDSISLCCHSQTVA